MNKEIFKREVFETDEYEQFHYLAANRVGDSNTKCEFDYDKKVFESRIRPLIKLMKRNGYDKNQPATIARIGNKKYILDGQGRIAAAKSAGITFFYTYDKSIKTVKKAEEYVFDINNCRTNWDSSSKIQSFGKKSTTSPELRSLIDLAKKETLKRPNGKLTNTMMLMFGQGAAKRERLLKGNYKLRESWVDAIEILNIAREYDKKFYENANFVAAVGMLVNNPSYDVKRDVPKLKRKMIIFQKMTTQKEYLRQFEEILNKNRTPKLVLVR